MAAVSDSGKVSTTIVSGSGKGDGVDSRLRSYSAAYETAKMNAAKGKAIVKGLEKMLVALESKTTVTKITAWEIDDGKTHLYVGSNFPRDNNRTLNGRHIITGLPAHNGVGQNGVIDSDITQSEKATNWNVIKYNQARADTNAIKTLKTPGTIRSNKSGSKATTRIKLNDNSYAGYFQAGSNGTITGSVLYAFFKKAAQSGVVGKRNDGINGWGFTQGTLYVVDDFSMSTDPTFGKQNIDVWLGFSNQYKWFKNTWYPGLTKKLENKKKAYKDAAKALKLPDPFTGANNKDNNGGGTPPNPKKEKDTTNPGDDTKPVIYNLPGVKDSYFTMYSKEAPMFVSEGNTPQKVAQASDLWAKANTGGHKGMIQSYLVPSKLKGTNWFKPEDIAGSANNREINSRRYGFQFLYNPSTVEMAYAGAPQVDIGLQISGQDKVPLIGAGVTSSTLSFQLLLNRMPDMGRLGQSRTWSEDGKTLTIGINKDAKNYYPWQLPDTAAGDGDARTMDSELALIAEMGTMYDVEYLLRTLLGYGLKSEMRGNKITADIGYLGAYPVELHLGRNLRYLVTIDSFNLNHTIFTKDMVPVFTNLSITCNRLPDFGKKIGSDIKTSITST
jgi:hypothetical protein